MAPRKVANVKNKKWVLLRILVAINATFGRQCVNIPLNTIIWYDQITCWQQHVNSSLSVMIQELWTIPMTRRRLVRGYSFRISSSNLIKYLLFLKQKAREPRINKESHYVIVKAIFQLGGQILTLSSRVPLNPAVLTKSAEAMDLYCSECLQMPDTP